MWVILWMLYTHRLNDTLTFILYTSWRISLGKYLQSPSSIWGSHVDETRPISPAQGDYDHIHVYHTHQPIQIAYHLYIPHPPAIIPTYFIYKLPTIYMNGRVLRYGFHRRGCAGRRRVTLTGYKDIVWLDIQMNQGHGVDILQPLLYSQ